MKRKSLRSKLSLLLVAVFISFSASAPAVAGTGDANGENAIKINLNGKYLVNDVAPIIQNSTTLVPVRMLSEELGAVVNWNNQNRTVIIKTNDDQEIVLGLGRKEADITSSTGSNAELMAAAPFIKDGRTMVPLRFIAEKLGLNVKWDNVERTVCLTSIKANDRTEINENIQDGFKVSSKNIESQNEAKQVKLSIPQIEGLRDEKVQADINKSFENKALQFRDETLDGLDEYVQECQKEGWPIRSYEAVTNYRVTFSANDVLSLYVDYYSYTGGAHGSTNRVASNIDLKTGKELQLKDLFKPGVDYKAILNQEIKKQMLREPDKYFPETLKEWQGISENQPYYIEDGNLVIYFSQYEIAPYASGIPEFKIPLANGFHIPLEVNL